MANAKTRNVENSSKLPLTARQREALEFIRRCVRKRGYGPTVREIGDQMGINSPNGVVGHLVALERKGFIHREANLSRSIMLVERGEKPLVGLPVRAELVEGKIVDNPDPEERIEISDKIQFSGDDFFLIRVQDEHLFNEYFFRPGDLLLVRRARNAGEGETVIIRDYENDFLLAHCELDENSGKTRLLNSTRWFENSCSGIYGVLVSVMRFQFDMN
ncbi:MAG: hypothetical protein E7028_04535 [Planctomycetaceae bacterium]|nr:hypothetical protein [Planctomycetaceae bacterium]MBQ2822140.1 hypothetical protein [Thermoguttaceae bacterium]MDO4424516.1 hypothetical protein [Planctomycetia bacterium]